ncbi:MAG: diaminopimelate epimerase [Planctomycetota bacterium]
MIAFTKMSGAGNDFILIDNRDGRIAVEEASSLARRICPRRTAVGADGLILLEASERADLRVRFLNPDGSEPAMCGNGARCAALFAHRLGAAKKSMTLRTLAGIFSASLTDAGVRIELPDMDVPLPVKGLSFAGIVRDAWFVNTGVPHAVLPVDDLEGVPVRAWGPAIRHHPRFAPEGTNADFLLREGDGRIGLRTYERGVEDETLACGTGALAAAMTAALLWKEKSPVTVRTRSGEALTVRFRLAGNRMTEMALEGPVKVAYTAELEEGC